VIDANDSYDVINIGELGSALLLTTTWVNAMRDGVLKSRLCAIDFAKFKRDDLFALGSNSLTNRVIDFKATKLGMDTYTADVTVAYNTIDEPEDVVVKPPQEWLDQRAADGLSTNVYWRMKKLLPSRRIAAKLWVERVGQTLKDMDFEQCPGRPQFFIHRLKGLTCEVHRDDIHGCGSACDVDEHLVELGKVLKLKKAQRHPAGSTYQHLKRIRHVKDNGRLIGPNPSYVTEVVTRLGLEDCKPVPTPSIDLLRPTADDKEEPLDEEQASEYRSLTCTLLYASYDIPEVQFTLRMLTTDLRTPSKRSWERLKRCTRYLKGVQDEGAWFGCEGRFDTLLISTDADWSGCKRIRKSSTCIILRVGDCCMYTQAVGQAIHGQSSGEAEFYGGVSGVSAGCSLKHVLDFIDMPVRLVLESDSSAARAVFWRSGMGKIRNLEAKTLWVQQMVADKELLVKAVNCDRKDTNPPQQFAASRHCSIYSIAQKALMLIAGVCRQ
jgi:hypothetical protein